MLTASFPCRLVLGLGVFGAVVLSHADQPPSLPPPLHPGGDQVFYFLLTDRFANGDTANDKGGSTASSRNEHGWDPTAIQFYHGGDFRGLTQKLDYLKDLGTTSLWITPPFRNKPTQGGGGSASGSYHGYWILDFLNVDPHLGTDADFRALIASAHQRELKVFPDIVVNHTADVLRANSGLPYVSTTLSPYRDKNGVAFDARVLAYNGLRGGEFPEMAESTVSFPYAPGTVAEVDKKNPAFLNHATLYHLRGDAAYTGEDFNFGEISGLDDLFTEKREVVEGFSEIYRYWMREYGVDGFRIDTVKHVNPEFWHAFAGSLRAQASDLARPDFLHFGEVYNGDPAYLSQWSTSATLDSVLDFGLHYQIREFVSKGQSASVLENLFAQDDLYTNSQRSAKDLVTFAGNHDVGRLGYFLRQDNPGATDARLRDLMKIGYGLLFFSRGKPVIYYGDEQGFVGTGGDTGAREDMFASQATGYAGLSRIGTTNTGAVDKFETGHPLYVAFRAMAALRGQHRALQAGSLQTRATANSSVLAFSRFERNERIEYLVVANTHRSTTQTVAVPVGSPAGTEFDRIFDSQQIEAPSSERATTDSQQRLSLNVAPLQLTVWKARSTLPTATTPLSVSFATPASNATVSVSAQTTEGQTFPSRQELKVQVSGAPDFAEVSFYLRRANQTTSYEYLGTDDAPPYRVFWRPPADLPQDTPFTVIAVADDRRGRRATDELTGLRWKASGAVKVGITGAESPSITSIPYSRTVVPGESTTLRVEATGTAPLYYQWYRDGNGIEGADKNFLTLSDVKDVDAGSYTVAVSNLAGTAVSSSVTLAVTSLDQPLLTADLVPLTVAPGSSLSLGIQARANTPLTYRWYKDDQLLPGATGPSFNVASASSSDAGIYQVIASANGLDTPSRKVRVRVELLQSTTLYNLSVRSAAGSGEQTLIVGCALQGMGTSAVLVRGIGPTLGAFGVPGVLADPRLTLYDNAARVLASNDNWGGGTMLSELFPIRGAFGLPLNSRDAALVAPLTASSFTLHATGADGGTGVALVELYGENDSTAALSNLSTRSVVGTGADVLIAGFVLSGNQPRRLLVRGIGPTLRNFGLSTALGDPVLKLVDPVSQETLAENDNWTATPALLAEFQSAGAFSLAPGTRDSVLLTTLEPGRYTVVMSGVEGATGVGLIEVYLLP